MSFKNFPYTDVDGEHFPDAIVGSDVFYGLDFTCWLANEEDTIVSAVWTLPDGLTTSDDFLQDTVGTIKIKALRAGSYVINCVLTSTETLNQAVLQQEKSIDTVLKVF